MNDVIMNVDEIKRVLAEKSNMNMRLQQQTKQNELDIAYLQGCLDLHNALAKQELSKLEVLDE